MHATATTIGADHGRYETAVSPGDTPKACLIKRVPKYYSVVRENPARGPPPHIAPPTHDIAAGRAQREADPELTPPLDRRLRDQTVQSQGGEHKSQGREQAEHPREHPLLAQLPIDTRRQRTRYGERHGTRGARRDGVRDVARTASGRFD